MEEYEKQEGVAFLLIHFASEDVYYYLTFRKLKEFYDRAQKGGPQSFNYDELEPKYQISTHEGVFVHYLETIQTDLDEREN